MSSEKQMKKWWLWIIPGLLIACLVLTAVSALQNLQLKNLPIGQSTISKLDKARLAEALNLRHNLGDSVFPGWGDAVSGQILYNEKNAFLVGLYNPEPGWKKVPQEIQRGSIWHKQPANELWEGTPYYRQSYNTDQSPEAFTVRVGEHYIGSMASFDWLRVSLMQQLRSDLPAFLQPVFPYRLAVSLLVSNSDSYIAMLEHENFHAYQAISMPERFLQAEQANMKQQDNYPWQAESGVQAWKQELEALKEALQTEDMAAKALLVQQFLNLRDQRRSSENLSADLIALENDREWLEGLARYVELESLRVASVSKTYQPVENMATDPLFDKYRGFDRRWKRELDQMVRMANDEGDGRFYYSGMAQAYLLDDLMPDWKTALLIDPSHNLEDLLHTALESR
jgi:hypothetical protein